MADIVFEIKCIEYEWALLRTTVIFLNIFKFLYAFLRSQRRIKKVLSKFCISSQDTKVGDEFSLGEIPKQLHSWVWQFSAADIASNPHQ